MGAERRLTEAQMRVLRSCDVHGYFVGYHAVPDEFEWALVAGFIRRDAPKDVRVLVLTPAGRVALSDEGGE